MEIKDHELLQTFKFGSSMYRASAGQNMGGGLIHGIVIFTCDNHYRPTNATWACNLCTFSGRLMGKLDKSDKVIIWHK